MCITKMVSSLNHRWNTILPDLILVAEKLEALGFHYFDGKVTVEDLKGEDDV
jgi:hypothetical protein